MTLRSVQYDFQQCNMLYIALGNNVATGYKYNYAENKYSRIIIMLRKENTKSKKVITHAG